MIIRQAHYWHKSVGLMRRIYEAEKELFTHCLTLAVILLLISSAAFVDVKLQPKEARAGSIQIADRDGALNGPSEARENTSAANRPASQPQPAPAPTAPPLPPRLAQNTENINPELLRRFDAFRTFIFQTYGVVLEIRSGYRSFEEQAMLFRTLPRGRANPPGRSNHEKGEAIDYTPYGPTYNQHLAAFGLMLPFPGKEDWHVERVEPH